MKVGVRYHSGPEGWKRVVEMGFAKSVEKEYGFQDEAINYILEYHEQLYHPHLNK